MTTLLFILALPTIITFVLIGVTFFARHLSKEQQAFWRLQLLIAFDQLANTWIFGWSDESISSRSYRLAHLHNVTWAKYMEVFVNFLFFWQPDHCYHAYIGEMERDQFPPDMRIRKAAGITKKPSQGDVEVRVEEDDDN